MNLGIFPTTCKPGENVQLSIGTTIQSTVHLLAIDQRVLLLKSGNDLTLNDIYGDFDEYNDRYGGGGDFFDQPLGPIRRRPWFWYETYDMKFEQVNLLIISNAVDNIPVNRCNNNLT